MDPQLLHNPDPIGVFGAIRKKKQQQQQRARRAAEFDPYTEAILSIFTSTRPASKIPTKPDLLSWYKDHAWWLLRTLRDGTVLMKNEAMRMLDEYAKKNQAVEQDLNMMAAENRIDYQGPTTRARARAAAGR